MKKILAILIVLMLLVSFAGCKKIGEKIGEKITENILENASGSDIDIDGDTMTVQGTDGSSTTIGGTEWPDSDLAKKIPELKKGTVSYVMESTDYLYVTVDSVEEQDAKDYIEEVKASFTVDPYEMTYDGGFSYTAKDDSGLNISVSYTEGTVLIMVSQEAS
ncbi:MAG TPA: DUF6591 domain-containing protein [Clostridia bacterium]|nr:DUF6591 domain-containing protein [Clostridia bacterium]